MFANFTEETCTGTGNTLALVDATTGRIKFNKSYSDGDLVPYALEDSGGIIKIAGIGPYVAATDDITRNDTWNWNGTVVDNNPSTNIALSGGAHTIRCDVVARQASEHHFPAPNTTYGVFSRGISGASGSHTALTVDRVYYVPFFLEYPDDFNGLSIRIETASTTGSKYRLGLYSKGNDGLPDNQLITTGDLNSTIAGINIGTGTSKTLEPGWYYIACVTDSNATFYNISTALSFANLLGALFTWEGNSYTHCYEDTPSWTTLPASAGTVTKKGNVSPLMSLIQG